MKKISANEFMANALKDEPVPSGVSKDGSDDTKITGYQFTALGALEHASMTAMMQSLALQTEGQKAATEVINSAPVVAMFRSTDKSTGKRVTLLCISTPNPEIKGARRNVPIAVVLDDPATAMALYEGPGKTPLVCTFGEMVNPKDVPSVSAEEVGNVFAGMSTKYSH